METTRAPIKKKFPRWLWLAGCTVALTGCTSLWISHRHQSSSVVQFLYPGKDQPFVQPSIPTLRLPLRVGVAFVPPSRAPGDFRPVDDLFPEAQKTSLLREVSGQFKALPFIQSIEVVPTTYLRPGGSFENLDQLRAIMGVDVIALIAFDQAQSTGDTAWSLSYWTIVGAYLIPAQKNATHTLMEAVVYDIPSRNLLFRAPGVSTVTGHSTLVSNATGLRADSTQGYVEAAKDLTKNLQLELDSFKVRIREEPQTIRLEAKPGYHGAGALGIWFCTLLVALAAGHGRRARRFFHRTK